MLLVHSTYSQLTQINTLSLHDALPISSATQSAPVTARYRCFTGACGNATQTFTLAPRQLRVFEDIVGTLFNAAEAGRGMELTCSDRQDRCLDTSWRPAPTVGMYGPGLS